MRQPANPLREFRRKRGLTQAALGTLCDVHASMISQIECGYVVPSLQLTDRIARRTRIPLQRLALFCLAQAKGRR